MDLKKLQIFLRRRFSVPKERPIRRAIHAFTSAERAVFYFLSVIFIFSGIVLLFRVNNEFLVEVPKPGGTLREGVIGNPRFINPVLAVSEADRNLTSLVYSGLLSATADGEIVLNLADSLEKSEDGLVYRIVLRDDAFFHDGKRVTADDVIFTIQKITDPMIKSPRRGNWDGVTIEKIDDKTITFTLKKAYAPFKENLTIGILPKHIWKNVTDDEFTFSQYNTLPVGSGPYKIARVERNNGGIPDYYKLSPFDKSVQSTSYIKNLIFRFFPNEESLLDAYFSKTIESFGGLSPDKSSLLRQTSSVVESPLPRVFGVFFNRNQSKSLAFKEVRQALDMVAPREDMISQVFFGFASAIDGPLPAGVYEWTEYTEETGLEERITQARELLEKNGWKPNNDGVLEKGSGSNIVSLSFSLATSDAPELKAVAQKLRDTWNRIGAVVDVQIFESGDLNQNIIRPRKFDALLFGLVVGKEADLYPFWHSSQRNDPGLNIALYTNARVDRLLDEARSTDDPSQREKALESLTEEIKNDIPAVFLYTPSYLYVLPRKVNYSDFGLLSSAQDRFLGVRDWYIEKDKVWKIFAN